MRPGLLILLTLAACGDKDGPTPDDSPAQDDSGPDDSLPEGTDADGDGVTAEDGDCDDANAAVAPGLAEACDGLDNNCNGVIDEGSADADADGVADCVDAEDCDGLDNDGDAAVDEGFSDADADGLADCLDVEGCDGVDNDADGLIDEGFDGDADGYTTCGDEATPADCDDADAAVSPGAAELDGDGLDNDCDALVDEGAWRAGDLAIVEIMVNPAAVADPAGEWVELLNTTGRTLTLDGLTLSTGSGSHRVVAASPVQVAPGALIVLASEARPSRNGGVSPAYAWTGLSLSNESDAFSVHAGGLLLDTVAWDDGQSFPDVSGASMAVDPEFMSAADNDVGGRWCAGVSAWGPGADLGSPGAPNPLCPNLDRDGDGYTPGEGDCDDLDASVGPGAAEVWYDGFDQDCDGLSDDDADLDGYDADARGGDDCDDTDPRVNPSAAELWYDGVDGNCDGFNDYDADADGFTSSTWGGDDCDDAEPTTNISATEACDGDDDDCDGQVDEFPCVSSCGDNILDAGEEYEPPPGPFTTATVDSATCRFDFSGVNQLYCNGSCSWAGSSGCDQSDANILCQLITGNPNSTATSWTSTTALSEHGFTCPGTRYGTVTNTDRGVNVTVYYTDGNIRSTHGAGSVIAYPVCTDP